MHFKHRTFTKLDQIMSHKENLQRFQVFELYRAHPLTKIELS